MNETVRSLGGYQLLHGNAELFAVEPTGVISVHGLNIQMSDRGEGTLESARLEMLSLSVQDGSEANAES